IGTDRYRAAACDDGADGAARRADHLCRRSALRAALSLDAAVGPVAGRGSATRRAHHVGACRRLLSGGGPVAGVGDARAICRARTMIEALQAWAARYAADRRY